MSDLSIDPPIQGAIVGGEAWTEDQHLEFTQLIRHRLIRNLTGNGQNMPNDPKDQIILLSTLDGLDRQAVNIKKIGAKERAGAADREAARIIALINAQHGNTDPFARQPLEGESQRILPAPTLDETGLPPLELVEGETAVGLATETFESFKQKYPDKDPREVERERLELGEEFSAAPSVGE